MMQVTDNMIVSRTGTLYKSTMQGLLNLVSDHQGTSEWEVATWGDVAAVTGMSLGDRLKVTDASGNATVDAGWAIFAWSGSGWYKIAEEEGLDIVIEVVNLGTTATPTHITITNSSSGSDTTIPLADAVNCGLLSPADFTKLSFISVTAAIDLDDILSKSHVAVTLVGTSQNNPLTVDANQVMGFSISQLDTLPA